MNETLQANGGESGLNIERVWHRRLIWFFGFLAVLPYVPLLTSGTQVFSESPYSDYNSYQLPLREFVQDEFQEGRFPHWIPWIGCGLPMHATQQTGLCYPLLTPLLLVLDANTSIKLAVFLHAIICFVGQYKLGRTLNLSRIAAGISALIATQSGFFTAHLSVGHISLVCAYALVPWLLYFVVKCSRTAALRHLCGISAVVGLLLLVGHPQVPYYAFLVTGIVAAAELLVEPAGPNRVRSAIYLAGGFMLGVMLAAVQLIPALALVMQQTGFDERGTLSYAEAYHLAAFDVYRQLVPSMCGNPVLGQPEFAPLDFFHEKISYLGWLTALLAGFGLTSTHRQRWPWLWGTLSLFCLLIALGSETPMFAMLYHNVPGMGLFRCPGRCLSIFSVLVSILAGRGFDALNTRDKLVEPRYLWFMGVMLAGGMIAVTLSVAPALDSLDWNAWLTFADNHLKMDFAASGIFCIASIAAIYAMKHISPPLAALSVAVILVFDLGYFNLRSLRFEPNESQLEFTGSSEDLSAVRVIDHDFARQAGAVRYSRLVPTAIRSQVRLVGTNEGGVLPNATETLFNALDENSDAALRVAACRYVVTPSRHLQQMDSLPLPRIWFCSEEQVGLCNIELAQLSRADVDLLCSSEDTSAIEVEVDSPQQIRIRSSSERAGKVIIADTWYSGWRATVDGQPVPIELAFGCFRAIPLAPGSHSLEVTYQPLEFQIAAGVSLAAFAFWLLATAAGLRRKYKAVQAQP
ncbi:MAG: hypothetical protein R3C18_07495 [Planctomycetaceae bacterium]